jgi:hypothetical protein
MVEVHGGVLGWEGVSCNQCRPALDSLGTSKVHWGLLGADCMRPHGAGGRGLADVAVTSLPPEPRPADEGHLTAPAGEKKNDAARRSASLLSRTLQTAKAVGQAATGEAGSCVQETSRI